YKRSTAEGDFHVSKDKKLKTPLMHLRDEELRFWRGDNFRVLELPYTKGEFSMLVFLPDAVDGLPEFEKSLTTAKLHEAISNLVPNEVLVTLPKFKMRSEFSLDPVLRDMGMTLAFIAGKADFSGMVGSKPLFIGLVEQNTFAEVNEEGSEMAAV